MAQELDRLDDALRWTREADRPQAAMVDELWADGRYVARSADGGTTWDSSSLLDLMPIVPGEHLPDDISTALAHRLEGHLTEHGPATEHPASPCYLSEGYWRGPIWTPFTVLIEDGLRRAGRLRLADDIGARFRALCETSGFAESFDALTGRGLRARAYTWTAGGAFFSPSDLGFRACAFCAVRVLRPVS